MTRRPRLVSEQRRSEKLCGVIWKTFINQANL